MLPFTSIAASAAFSSARAEATGSTIPAGTTVRGSESEFVIAGLSSWWPVWLSAIVVFGILILAVLLFALLGILKFRKVLARQNPAQAVAEDIRLVKEAGDDEF